MLRKVTNYACALIVTALLLSFIYLNFISNWESLGVLILVALISSVLVIALSITNILSIKLNKTSDKFPFALGVLLVLAIAFLLLVLLITLPTGKGDLS